MGKSGSSESDTNSEHSKVRAQHDAVSVFESRIRSCDYNKCTRQKRHCTDSIQNKCATQLSCQPARAACTSGNLSGDFISSSCCKRLAVCTNLARSITYRFNGKTNNSPFVTTQLQIIWLVAEQQKQMAS